MKSRLLSYGISAAALAGVVSLLLVSAPAAQDQAGGQKQAGAKAEVPTPRMMNGHPDLTGYWAGNQGAFFTEQKNDGDVPNVHFINRTNDGSIFYDYAGAEGSVGQSADSEEDEVPITNQASYKMEYMTKVKQIAATYYGSATSLDPQQDCKPHGVPRAGFGGFVVSSPLAVAMMYEAAPGPYYRIIYTDGRHHPKDLDSSYMGHSIGTWDGDTLVVDTVGLNDETWLGGGKFTTIHSDQEHVTERITRKGNSITYEATVEDPVMLTKPWVMTPRHVQLSPPDPDKYYIQPEMCVNNDKSHLIQESATDKYKCGWCQKDPDAVYGQGAAADLKANRPKKNTGGVGGGEQ